MSAGDEDVARFDALVRAFPDTYTLERQIGRGGMARVYRALDRKHGRPVAIKVMRSDLARHDGTARFLDEIRLTARLTHPHILPLLDSGTVEGTPFFVMPLVEGETLRARLRRDGRLPVDETLAIAGEVADALAYAHAQGVVHCDVKPDNILLAGRHALVADFGVARALRAVAGAGTPAGAELALGTLAYMSPEQILGDEAVDGRSDVYSLSIVAFEVLAGCRPYDDQGERDGVMERLAALAPSVRTWRADVPEMLDLVLQTAMAGDRQARFATAVDFADALAAVGRGRHAATAAARPDVRPPSSIAVLPFRNLSAEPDSVYLSEGITDEVTAALGRYPTFRVCAGASARTLAGAALEPRIIGERLGVQYLLSGSVRRAGGHLRVSAELVSAADGFQLWARHYDRTFSDVMAVQDDIAEAIAVSLAGRATPMVTGVAAQSDVTTRLPATAVVESSWFRTPSPARDPRANELYLRGRFLWNRRTADRLVEAGRCFEEAVALDPGFALAHAGRAAAQAMTALYGASPPRDAMEGARRAAERALSLDPTCAEARTALALVLAGYDWRWADAERQLRAASVSAQNDATPHQWLASMCLLPQGRIEDALGAIGRALRRDPLSLTVKTTLASVLYCARRYEEAAAAARDVAALDPVFAPAHFFLGQALTLLGDHAGALAACRRACELAARSAESLAVLGVALHRSGDVGGARATRDELRARAASGYVSKGQLALACLGAGEPDAALDCLEAAVEERATDLIWLGSRPLWDPLRGHPRFTRVLARLNLAV